MRDTNMREQTIVARRTVNVLFGLKDISEPKAVSKLEINKDMLILKYCRSARSKYRQFLDAQKADDKNKRKGVSVIEVEKNKALFEAEKRKVTAFENNIEKVSSEADLLKQVIRPFDM